ncbi:MAG: hypothetical protein CMD33_02575 [Flavobacteriales bacterium]|nr:hypothetical protein [Flavobacteriales bacterium]
MSVLLDQLNTGIFYLRPIHNWVAYLEVNTKKDVLRGVCTCVETGLVLMWERTMGGPSHVVCIFLYHNQQIAVIYLQFAE